MLHFAHRVTLEIIGLERLDYFGSRTAWYGAYRLYWPQNRLIIQLRMRKRISMLKLTAGHEAYM